MQAFHWLVEFSFARNAMLAGLAIGSVCSLLSVIVVLKRMAFIGEGVSHAGFGGVGTAIFLGLAGLRQDLVVFAFCLATAIAIGVLSRRRRVDPDSAIGILLVAAMSWGVLMDNLRSTFQQHAWYQQLVSAVGDPAARPPGYEQLLFGSLLNVGQQGVWLAFGLGFAVLLVAAALFKEIIFFAFDESSSRVFGVRTGAIYYTILTLLAVTIVISIRLAGFVLVSALLVIPGSTALMLSRRLGPVFFWSWLIGTGGTVGGLLLALEAGNLSPGACIVGVLCLVFGLVFAARGIARRLSMTRSTMSP
ncbi:MAG: metal ABC transporter permease [Planctomycetota bacterium]|nr:metal ABC transporter permease [Planctomycetota bacterium]